MPIVSFNRRLELIKELPTGIQKLCRGEINSHRVLFRCAFPLMCYEENRPSDREIGFPGRFEAAQVLPLWECCETITFLVDGGFYEFFVEEFDSFQLISHSARGMMTYLLFFLLEDLGDDQVNDAASPEHRELRMICDELELVEFDSLHELRAKLRPQMDRYEQLLNHCRAMT